MDSFTQLTLGAAVGEAVLGHKVGRRAALWGAICGTLPDLDVLISLGDPVSDFTYHRGVSHAFFFMTLAAPLVVWLIMRIHPKTNPHRLGWLILVLLAFYTHALLDCFTVYGTQIWLPFSNHPVAWSTISIIDPAYTVPLLIGVLCALLIRRSSSLGHRLNAIGLTLSCLYLVWTASAKFYVDNVVEKSIELQNITHSHLLSTPTPFNSLLWRFVVMENNSYYEGFYSVFDQSPEVQLTRYKSQPELLQTISGEWAVQRLQWFSKGFFKVSNDIDKIVITDLRMGWESFYVFSFAVGIIDNNGIQAIEPEQQPPNRLDPVKQLLRMWRRIWDEEIHLIL